MIHGFMRGIAYSLLILGAAFGIAWLFYELGV